MNHDDPKHRTPPRAEPLQPDRPGRGSDKEEPAQPARRDDHVDKAKEQTDTALENVREGYGGPGSR